MSATGAPLEEDERFRFEAELGAGASGVVHRAFDKARGETIAIKTLSAVDPGSLFRFKAEFRALANIVHPNLLQLHELLLRDGRWLLTMELVEGRDFLQHVRPRHVVAPDDQPDADTEVGVAVDLRAARPLRSSWPANTQHAFGSYHASVDDARLRGALRQLAHGLAALHASGRVHCDLKPANVLVFDHDARLVICDFGLVTEVRPRHDDGARDSDELVAGTLAFMAPEQASGQGVSPASDFYAVGVMLYQALTGVVPINARAGWARAVHAKREAAWLDPRQFAPDAPEDLSELAMALLHPDPTRRPGHAELIIALQAPRTRTDHAGPVVHALVGRGEQLAALQSALLRTREGNPSLLFVCGRSGMGKSTLVQQFIAGAQEREGALVLSGRCYEREQLPHKAFDALIDALSNHLLSLSESTLRQLLPDSIDALARLFPVLRRIPAIAAAPAGATPLDPLEHKRRAYAAFRELCGRLARRRPLILYIDDLQWGDLDSGPWFTELLRPPLPPAVLLLCAHRLEDEASSGLLRALRETHLPDAQLVPARVEVDELSEAESEELARSLLASDRSVSNETIHAIVREAAGSPFFVRELALHVHGSGAQAVAQLRLEGLLDARVANLGADARQLLAVVAAAGRPESLRVVRQAAGAIGVHAALRTLEAERLVQLTGLGEDDRIEAYHDRIREAAYRSLDDAQRRAVHSALAASLEQHDASATEALFEHHRAAGELVRAGQCALLAAEKAERALAFGRAADLYAQASALQGSAGEQARALAERRGQALVFAGRGIEAAAAFSGALAGAPREQAMRLRALATTQLLRSGQLTQAFELLRSARDVFGLSVPASDLKAVGMMLWRRLKLRLRRWLGRRRSTRPDADQLRRMDTLWGVASALSCIDLLRGSLYQGEYMLLALRAGEPGRLACALGVEANLHAAQNREPGRTQDVINQALELTGVAGDAFSLSVVKGTSAVCRLLEGRFRESAQLGRETEEIIRNRLHSTLSWDLVTATFFGLQASALLGNVQELVDRVPEVVRDAEARGDLYAATTGRTWRSTWAWLGPDRADAARDQLELANRQWTQPGYHLQHGYSVHSAVDIGLYTGVGLAGLWQRLQDEWKAAFFFRQIQHGRVEMLGLRARVALALAHERRDPRMLTLAHKDALAMAREPTPWARAYGCLLRAAAESFDAPALGQESLREAEGRLDAVDMKLHAAGARLRRAQLSGDRALLDDAAARIQKLGVHKPARFARLLAPGFADP
jgi:eukaryotic-like serine/threonine-protein kinase